MEGCNMGAAGKGWACLCQPCDSGWREGAVLASHASSCWSRTCIEQPGNCGKACMREGGVRRRGARCLAGRSTDHSLHAAVTRGVCGVTLRLPSANTAGCKSIIWGVCRAFLSFCSPALYVLLLFLWNISQSFSFVLQETFLFFFLNRFPFTSLLWSLHVHAEGLSHEFFLAVENNQERIVLKTAPVHTF